MHTQTYLETHASYEELLITNFGKHKLRLITPDIKYAKDSLEWVRDKDVVQYMGSDFSNVSLEGEEKRLRDIVNDNNAYHWIVECDGKAIGNININEINQISEEFGIRSGTLNYLIGNKVLWGQGIATAIARQVLDWAFSKGQFEIIKSRVLVQNKASQAVLKKLGFSEYGREDYDGPDIGKDTWYITYKISMEDWKERDEL
jgi:RimJ/RimL family protein N-acetyltransferase